MTYLSTLAIFHRVFSSFAKSSSSLGASDASSMACTLPTHTEYMRNGTAVSVCDVHTVNCSEEDEDVACSHACIGVLISKQSVQNSQQVKPNEQLARV